MTTLPSITCGLFLTSWQANPVGASFHSWSDPSLDEVVDSFFFAARHVSVLFVLVRAS